MTERESVILLNMVPGLGGVRLKRLLESFGRVSRIIKAKESQLLGVRDIGEGIAAGIVKCASETDSLKKELALIEKENVQIITISDDQYPASLKEIYDPPPVLYLKGSLLSSDLNSVALVGSRRASFYGQSMCERLAYELAAKGISVVSGLARGIDTAAHRGALRARGRTIAVLGSGITRIYPRENKELAEQISNSGCLLSEFPLCAHPARENFPRRNRIISGLSLGVVIVEAAQRSGALITANFALEQGREVFAVPGKIDSLTSWGTHSLIKDGAKLVENANDIITELGLDINPSLGKNKEKRQGECLLPNLTSEEKEIYSFLSTDPQYIDEIAKVSGVSLVKVLSLLVKLELKKLTRQLPGKMFVRT